MKEVNLYTADWHLRDDCPKCLECKDWLTFQIQSLQKIYAIAKKEKCENIFALGDLFNTPRQSELLISRVIQELSTWEIPVYAIAGNHDLPYHNYDNLDNSSIGILFASGVIKEMKNNFEGFDAMSFGKDAPTGEPTAFTHQLVFDPKHPLPPGVGTSAEDLPKQFPQAKLICCGDYHHHYIWKGKKCTVINPGCINIQVRDMTTYQPVVYVDERAIPIKQDYLFVEETTVEKAGSNLSKIEFDSGFVGMDFLDCLKKEMGRLDRPAQLELMAWIENLK